MTALILLVNSFEKLYLKININIQKTQSLICFMNIKKIYSEQVGFKKCIPYDYSCLETELRLSSK